MAATAFDIATEVRRREVTCRFLDADQVHLMSTKVEAILKEIKALPPEEQRQVLDEALHLRTRTCEWEQQQARLRDMQSRHAGRGLLQRLLEIRAEERSRG